jgi:rhamnogalacturonyl hydrolase YesR
MQCYNVTGDPEFLNAARSWSEAAGWSCGEKRPLNADDVASAQTFLDVYFADKKPEQIEQIRRIFESEYFGQDMIAYKKVGNNSPWKGEGTVPFIGRHIWWWADSLFMAPPLMARLGAATGDPRYYELLHKLYWDTVAFLYNGEERLIFRDQTLFGAKTPGGKPAFWGRGNGWVIGGLVRTIDYLPETDPMRPKYIRLFQDMMARIVTLQGEDGLWRSSLNEPEWFPMKETSGSSFFCFGLAAGINRGWLDRETYYPHMVCAWEGLVGCLSPEGQLQWSQGVGDRPRKTDSGNSNIYTQGSFLMAAAEIYRMETTRNRDAANGANLGKLK